MDDLEKKRNEIARRRLQISGVKLQNARKKEGYTRKEVAKYLDHWDYNLIRLIEEGRRAISLEDLMCLSYLYKVSCKKLGAFNVLLQEIPHLGKDPTTQKDLRTWVETP